MPITRRSFFSFPGLALGLGIAIAFFKLYGPLTRPAVPTPVSATIDHFAPGVAIGVSVDEATKKVAGLKWVDDRGFIGKPTGSPFDEVRIIPKRSKTGQLVSERSQKVDYVELVAFNKYSMMSIMRDISIAFGSPFSEGCLEPVGDGYPYRQVRYWTTKSDRGGAAVINDWTSRTPRLYYDTMPDPWSIITWAGKFGGSTTLKGHYEPVPCLNLVGKPS
jgi:hypothetical protein